MKALSLSYFGDLITVSFISFALSLVAFNYFLTREQSIVFSLAVCFIFTLIFARLLYKKRIKKNNKILDSEHYSSIMLQLNYQTKTKNNELFHKALLATNEDAVQKKGGTFLPSKKTLVVTMFGFDEVKKSDLIKAFNLITKDEIVEVYAENFSAPVLDFASRFNGKIILNDGKNAYSLLQKAKVFPPISFSLNKQKTEPTFKMSNVFLKKRAKTFFGFGIAFLFLSYFVPLKLYYVICGAIMLILSVICIFFGKTQKEISKS